MECKEVLYYKNDTLWHITQVFLEMRDVKMTIKIQEENAF